MKPSIQLLFALALSAPATSAQLIGGGFEEGEFLVAFPSSFGVWGVDLMSFVEAENGIAPAEGQRMARFDATTLGAPGVGEVADVWNLADLEPWSDLVAGGHAHLRVEARFNRVPGSPCVDTQFAVQTQAQDGVPDTYPFDWPDPIAASEVVTLESDGDVATWESVSAGLDLPSETTFAAVILFAIENVCPTGVPPFEGHYADDVRLFVDAWIDIGFGSSGADAPALTGRGELRAGAEGELELSGATPGAYAALVSAYGPTQPIPLGLGTLAAFPVAAVELRPVAADGTALRSYTMPPSVPPGVLVTAQFAIQDPLAPGGVQLSNAVEGLTHL